MGNTASCFKTSPAQSKKKRSSKHSEIDRNLSGEAIDDLISRRRESAAL